MANFSPKARKLNGGQKGLIHKIRVAVEQNKAPIIWVHSASLGEFEQGRPVIEAIKSRLPGYSVFLTFFSPSGYEIRKNYSQADYVFYLPFDSASNARSFLGTVSPVMGIFIKYEFWYHYISTANRMGIPLISISTIFKPNQPFFKIYGGLHRQMLADFRHFFVQNDTSELLLKSLGLTNVTISGDTRYDRVLAISKTSGPLPLVERFKDGKLLCVAGSTWPSDIDVIAPILTKYALQIKCIIAPHEIGDRAIQALLGQLPNSITYSKAMEIKDVEKYDFLIIDNIGMLSSLYQYGNMAFIGGGFRGGLHNTLEAAAWGIPVIFGAHEKNAKFQEALDLIANEAAFEIANGDEFEKKYSLLIVDDELRLKAGCNALLQVQNNAGATEKIMTYIQNILP